jgi:iron complex outermembrane receptor protein
MLASSVIYAQSTISGNVTSNEGALPGANVIVKGTQNGTATDFDGNYTLDNVADDAVLVFSSLGYVSKEVAVNGNATIDAFLESDSQSLDEVVIIGYGSVRKSDATGAIDAIGSKDFTTVNAASPAQILRGKVAGVQVTQSSGEPGGGVAIRVRGNSSIRSGNDPLIVVDGIPLAGGNISAGGVAGDLGSSSAKNPLNFVNQNDIESINILKDASSTAIYGSRGANGVILITTKKGTSGAPRLEYSTSVGFSSLSNDLGLMSSEQFAQQTITDGVPGLDHGSRGYDWTDAILRTATAVSHDLSASFSGENSRTRVSLGYLDQEGILQKTGVKKYTFSLNNSLEILKDRVRLETNVLLSQISDEGQSTSDNAGFIGNVIGSALYWNPTYPLRNPDGSYFEVSDTYLNPADLLNSFDDNTETTKILASISPIVKITEGLEYKFVFGVDYSTSSRASQMLPTFNLQNTRGTTSGGDPAGGFANINNVTRFNKTFENILTYKKEVSDDFSFNALLGYSYYSYEYKSNYSNAAYFNLNQTKLVDNMEGGKPSEFRAGSSKNTQELQSFFGRLETTIFNDLLVNVSLRMDGSSKVGDDSTYSLFPAVGIAYKIFDGNDGILNSLKARVNYGIVGNQEFGVYSSLSWGRYNNGSLSQSGNPNSKLKWETTTSYGIGVDFQIIDKLSGSLDYFYKKTEDLVFPASGLPAAPNNTVAQTFINLPGYLQNNGFEISLNYDAVQKEDWSLSFSANASFLDNKMKDFPLFILTGGINGQGLTGANASIIANDLPLYTYYLNEWRGIDANGSSIYAAADGSDTGLGGASKSILKEAALPTTNIGFNINATYKKFDFNAAFYGSYGGYLYNNTANALFFKGSFYGDRNIPLEYAQTNQLQSDPNSPSTRYLESSDFFRLGNLNVGYTFDGDKLGSYIDRLRIYASGNNLFVITDYSGFDPEVDTNKQINGVNSAGMDYYSYPASRGFTFGLTVGF